MFVEHNSGNVHLIEKIPLTNNNNCDHSYTHTLYKALIIEYTHRVSIWKLVTFSARPSVIFLCYYLVSVHQLYHFSQCIMGYFESNI